MADTDADAITHTKQWSMEQLESLSETALIALWQSLPAPSFEEFEGEFASSISNESREGHNAYMFDEESALGYWLGKAYLPETASTGQGYNRWRHAGDKVARNGRFGTEDGISLFDGRPALMMHYADYSPDNERVQGPQLVDEIRELGDRYFIGIGTVENDRKVAYPFILQGPIGPWVGVDDERAEPKK